MDGPGSYKDAAQSLDKRHPQRAFAFLPALLSPQPSLFGGPPLESSRLISFRLLHRRPILIRNHLNPAVQTLHYHAYPSQVHLVFFIHHVDHRAHRPRLLHPVRAEAEAEFLLSKHHPRRGHRWACVLLSVERIAPFRAHASAIPTPSSHRAIARLSTR